ncbi:MAG: hypothetical protein GYA14_08485 [Ignavibacteria bacterium]|nr:hypothetical protein [Ignavibacteria bacterium]
MYRLSFLFVFILAEVLFAQNSSSIQINGGFISKRMSSLGLNSSVQYNHGISENFELYGYVGYAAWDYYEIAIQHELRFYKSVVEDDHNLYSAFGGARTYFGKTDWFTAFVEAEIGYLYLSYNNYKIFRGTLSSNQIAFYPDYGTKKYIKENLFGIGLGAGIIHPMSGGISLVFYYKLNTYINSKYNGLFSKRGTYSLFNVGFNYKI